MPPEEEKSSIDNLAEGSLEEQLSEEPKPEETHEEPKKDEASSTLLSRLDKMEERLLERDQEIQFLRGYVAQQGDRSAPAPKDETPQEFQFDPEKVTKDIETRGSEALVELVRNVIKHERADIEKKIDEKLQGQLGRRDQVDTRRKAFETELNNCVTEFSDAWESQEFKNEADQVAARILQTRLGRQPQFPNDMQHFQPGDLYSAASRVYAKWEREGKVGNKTNGDVRSTSGSTIREITRRVPRSDDLGSRSTSAAPKVPKKIDDIEMPDREKAAAKNVFRRLKDLNPGMTEERWVANYLKGQREAEA